MSALEIILGIVCLVVSVIMIIVVILQEGHQKGIGTVTGGADTFFAKNKARSLDNFLATWTKIFAIVFFLAIVGINCYAFFTK